MISGLPETLDSTPPFDGTSLHRMATQIRIAILEQSLRAHVGHIGSALSVTDLMAGLYGRILHISSPSDPDRDRFVLSKGHAALALYCALYFKGVITRSDLDTYCGDESLLGVHPEHELEGIDFSTGSLGHGLGLATGAALAAKLQHSKRRVFVLMSDAECNEGSSWESAMFAAQHGLGNLIAVIDLNGQQAFGYTKDVLDLSPIDRIWRDFRWDVHVIDGHDIEEFVRTVASLDTSGARPHMLVARTVFGKGVSFMERQICWHYLPVSQEQFTSAFNEIAQDL